MKAFRTLFTMTALTATLLTSGCASIVGDSKYPVNVSSTPSGANFTDQEQGRGTSFITVPRPIP